MVYTYIFWVSKPASWVMGRTKDSITDWYCTFVKSPDYTIHKHSQKLAEKDIINDGTSILFVSPSDCVYIREALIMKN